MTEQTFAQKEKAEGVWAVTQTEIRFNREWGGVRFTDEQVAQLLAGQEIEFNAVSKRTGNPYTARGKLEVQEYSGREFIGFKPDFGPKKDAAGNDMPPESFAQYTFTPEEHEQLKNGEKIYVTQFISKKGNEFAATVSFDIDPEDPNGGDRKKILLDFGN